MHMLRNSLEDSLEAEFRGSGAFFAQQLGVVDLSKDVGLWFSQFWQSPKRPRVIESSELVQIVSYRKGIIAFHPFYRLSLISLLGS